MNIIRPSKDLNSGTDTSLKNRSDYSRTNSICAQHLLNTTSSWLKAAALRKNPTNAYVHFRALVVEHRAMTSRFLYLITFTGKDYCYMILRIASSIRTLKLCTYQPSMPGYTGFHDDQEIAFENSISPIQALSNIGSVL